MGECLGDTGLLCLFYSFYCICNPTETCCFSSANPVDLVPISTFGTSLSGSADVYVKNVGCWYRATLPISVHPYHACVSHILKQHTKFVKMQMLCCSRP